LRANARSFLWLAGGVRGIQYATSLPSLQRRGRASLASSAGHRRGCDKSAVAL